MKTSEIKKELLWALQAHDVDALIRFKDYSGFFDSDQRRLTVLLVVASNCEVNISNVGLGPDIIIAFSNLCDPWCGPAEERHSYEPFYREVIRVGLLLEKLISLIDPNAKVVIDYPSPEEIMGRELSRYDDFKKEYPIDDNEEKLSTIVPDKLKQEVDSYLDLVIPRQNHMLGICHWIWGMKKVILRYGFNIDWKTPAEKNPGVIYD